VKRFNLVPDASLGERHGAVQQLLHLGIEREQVSLGHRFTTSRGNVPA
jgi:hypothetical protein